MADLDVVASLEIGCAGHPWCGAVGGDVCAARACGSILGTGGHRPSRGVRVGQGTDSRGGRLHRGSGGQGAPFIPNSARQDPLGDGEG